MTTGVTVDNPLVSLTTLKDIRVIEKHILPLKGIMKFLQIAGCSQRRGNKSIQRSVY